MCWDWIGDPSPHWLRLLPTYGRVRRRWQFIRRTTVWLVVAHIAFLPSTATAAIELINVDNNGVKSNGHAYSVDISAGGRYVLFRGESDDLVHGDQNEHADLFLRDRKTATTVRVSVASDGTEPNAPVCCAGDVSADGRYVVFATRASNLVPDDDAETDLFLRDRLLGTTTMITTGIPPFPAHGGYTVSMSNDGRYVSFSASLNPDQPGEPVGPLSIFVYDRISGMLRAVSADIETTSQQLSCYATRVSRDASTIAMECYEVDAVSNPIMASVFAYDLAASATTLLSVDADGRPATGFSVVPDISPNGRFVTWLFAEDEGSGVSNLYVHDRDSGTSSVLPDLASQSVSVSDDGDRLIYSSSGTHPEVPKGQVTRTVRSTSQHTIVSKGIGGVPANRGSYRVRASDSGLHVAFDSLADNLVANDTSDTLDVFLSAPPCLGRNSVCGDPVLRPDLEAVLGCEFIDCCPFCRGPFVVDWMIYVHGSPDHTITTLQLENLPDDVRRALKISGPAHWADVDRLEITGAGPVRMSGFRLKHARQLVDAASAPRVTLANVERGRFRRKDRTEDVIVQVEQMVRDFTINRNWIAGSAP